MLDIARDSDKVAALPTIDCFTRTVRGRLACATVRVSVDLSFIQQDSRRALAVPYITASSSPVALAVVSKGTSAPLLPLESPLRELELAKLNRPATR